MISVLLYGRNDSYGYNLHKRAALSLNCIAELLTSPTDEIIFVDYNTPDDFPTFPEAIQDTLTPQARRVLRILRVRPRHHRQFAGKTHLFALEPIARNVGLRRSSPESRWVLSTNTDMIFVPRRGRSLSEVAADLRDGHYHLPRFELPETLWETLDRLDAPGTIRQVEQWGREFHLNEVVHAQDPAVRYDAPGDFQLMLRSDLFRIHGFDERMMLGWHVDSNIAKRLFLLNGRVGDIFDEFFGYHCDHTRQATPMHRAGSTQNSLETFLDGVTTPYLPQQADAWGLVQQDIEEFLLGTDSTAVFYMKALQAAISERQQAPSHVHYAAVSYGRIGYDVSHVLPFLADALASYPRSIRIGWFGTRPELLQAFAAAWRSMGGLHPILVANTCAAFRAAELPACIGAANAEIAEQAEVLIFDWGLPLGSAAQSWKFEDDPAVREVIAGFRAMVQAESARTGGDPSLLRRFIGVNAIHNRCETVFQSYIGATRSPLSSRLRQGFLIRDLGAPRELIKQLSVGAAGTREPEGISSVSGVPGHVCYGPYIDLIPGWYRITAKLTTKSRRGLSPLWLRSAALEVISGSNLISCYEITSTDLKRGEISFLFFVSTALSAEHLALALEFRLVSLGRGHIVLTSLTVAMANAEVKAHIDRTGMPPSGQLPSRSSRRAIIALARSSRGVISRIVRRSRR